MPANRKRLAVWAPEDRWQLLGELLAEHRRVGLGIGTMIEFARKRLPPTLEGNPNRRRVDDLENSRRPNRWPAPTLKEMAAAYGVTYESVLAVLNDQANCLTAVTPGDAPPLPARTALPAPPQSQLLREEAVRPFADPIWERLLDLRDRGVHDPSGEQLGFPPGDATVWDDSAGSMPLSDRVWLIGTLRRNRAARAADGRSNGASTA